MGSVHIKFPTGYSPTEDYDFLWKRAAETLRDLFPSVDVSLAYQQAQQAAGMPEGVLTIAHSPTLEPDVISESIEPVIDPPGMWRQLTLRMNSEARRFLGTDSHGTVPQELKYAFAICQDVTRYWTLQLHGVESSDIKEALTEELSTWIVAHLAADKCYSFSTAGRGLLHDTLARTVALTVQYLKNLALTRVEHGVLAHGVVVAAPRKGVRPLGVASYPDCVRSLKRTPLLADGTRTAVWIAPDGKPLGLLSAQTFRQEHSKKTPFGPLGFLAVASASLNGLGLALRTDGTIVVFAKGRPLSTFRNGRWRGMIWSSVRDAIAKEYGETGKLAFDTSLILSTTGKGGILGIIESSFLEELFTEIDAKDRVDMARRDVAKIGVASAEWIFHALLPADEVNAIKPALLAVLAAIDGATLLTRDGRLLSYGAILPSRPSQTEGSRSAAARLLSRKGFVIKVSADGPITLYMGESEVLEA